jgi:hypothetical protein
MKNSYTAILFLLLVTSTLSNTCFIQWRYERSGSFRSCDEGLQASINDWLQKHGSVITVIQFNYGDIGDEHHSGSFAGLLYKTEGPCLE